MRLLFICTHNRCRSVIAEAVTNHLGQGHLQARSAGSQPSGEVHPLSIRYLEEAGIETAGLCSQSWDEHEAWQPDVVITVCDQAAEEPCPVWFGNAVQVHWGLADPSKLKGSDEEIATAFRHIIALLEKRIARLLAARVETMDEAELRRTLEQLGDI